MILHVQLWLQDGFKSWFKSLKIAIFHRFSHIFRLELPGKMVLPRCQQTLSQLMMAPPPSPERRSEHLWNMDLVIYLFRFYRQL